VRDRQLHNLEWHQQRVDKVSRECFGKSSLFTISDLLKIPPCLEPGDYKCRLIYSNHIERIEFAPYSRKKVTSLRLIEHNSINYSYKSTDRTQLKALFDQRSGSEDILIVRNDLVTDSYYANVVFYDGKQFITPSMPLLQGTKRAKLIAEGRIKPGEITRRNIWKFNEIHLINAMIDLGEIVINTEQVTS